MKMTGKIIAGLLALIGFAGCDGGFGADPEYGSPHADYDIKGRVVNEAGEGVPDIEITVNVDTQTQKYPLGGVTTDTSGNYEIGGEWMTVSGLTVTAEDVDGEDNGGEFAAEERKFELKTDDFVGGDGHWYDGKVTKTVDFTLTLKPQENENE